MMAIITFIILLFQNYYHVSLRQIQYWTPKPINFLLYEPEANLKSRDKNKVIIQEMENFVDLTQDSADEHGIYSNLEVTTEVTVQDKVMHIYIYIAFIENYIFN